ncbi:MAG: pyridoxal phosphate-dependent aminotransferase, partial [Planctomycetes bacterium]|nr:pyridoxal phosphate-dependent aminotransferase [Planctomycetota bacterium]
MSAKDALSKRAADGQPSMTLAVTAKAKQLKAEGKDVVSFAAGEPDFKTPAHICAAAKKAIDDGLHGYLPNPGMPALRQAVCDKFKEDIGVEYVPNNILVSPGAKYSLYLAIETLIEEGDEVILPAPYWVSYPEMVRLAGGTTVYLQTSEEAGFSFTADDLAKMITPKTKLLILNSPSNPTGGIIPPAEIEKIGKLLEEKGVWCISDEIYDKLVYGDAVHKSIASVSDYCKAHTIVVNGVSKTYAMTGWRIGYAAGDEVIIKAMANIQSQATSNACSIAQAAALEALTGPQDCVKEMHAEFAKRQKLIVDLLNDIEGVSCRTPGGAFYVLPNISGVFGKTIGGVEIKTPMDFCNVALEQILVAP